MAPGPFRLMKIGSDTGAQTVTNTHALAGLCALLYVNDFLNKGKRRKNNDTQPHEKIHRYTRL